MRIIFLFVFTLLVQTSAAQEALSTLWEKSFSSTFGETEGWTLSADASGQIYFPYFSDTSTGQYDIICRKFDSDGNELWATPYHYNQPGYQYAFVANAETNALYIGGCDCPILKPECDMLILKVDKANAQLIWDQTKAFGPNGYEEVDGLEILGDTIFSGGWCNPTGANFNSDIGLWSLNTSGNSIWTNSLGVGATAEHQDGHFVVDDEFIYAAGMWGGTGIFNLYDGRQFLGKFSKADGSLIDSVLFGPAGTWLNSEDALGMASDGEYLYLTGYSTPFSSNDWQIFVAKYDKQLTQQWMYYWGGTGTEAARGITVNDGIILIAGGTNSPEFNLAGEFDGALVLFNTDGIELGSYVWGDAQDNEFRDILVSGNSIYISGTSGILFSIPSPQEAFLIKSDLFISDYLPELIPQKILLSPNPASDQMRVVATRELEQFHITDATGRMVLSASGLFLKEYELNVSSLAAGMYFLHYEMRQNTGIEKFIVVR